MKIVMCTDAYWPRVNGVTVSVDSFSRALIRAGHQVVIVCSFYPDDQGVGRISGAEMDRARDPSEPTVIRVPSYTLPISKEDRVAKFHKWFWVSKQLNAFAPDIVHVNSEFVIGEFGFYYAKTHSLPVVYTFHTLWEDYAVNYIPWVPEFILRFIARWIIKGMCNRAATVIAPTDQIVAVMQRYKVKKRPHLLPTGIDPTLFAHDAAEIEDFRQRLYGQYPALRDRRILLFAGRIGREKNISFLLRILPRVVAAHPDVMLVLAGNGPELRDFEEEAAGLGIADRCVFTGYLDRSDLSLLYAISELFVFPSRTETQGLVTIEAMLSGTPVVAIGEMGTRAVMGGDNGGFMVRNDPDEFASRVIQLLSDPDLYGRKAREAIEHAQAWSIDNMARRLEGIYRETLDAFHAAR